MSSSYASVLAELDASLQNIHSQLAALAAGREVDDVKLNNGLADARHHASRLRRLVHAERSDADWNDRRGLIQVIAELEAATEAKRNEQRRVKLLELAAELDAGRITHRFATRVAELDAMRLEAVHELRNEAARRERLKDLPGPLASAWMHWACALDEDRDAPVLRAMGREFPTLEQFACAMEEAYWAPGTQDASDPLAVERSYRPPAIAGSSKVVAMPVHPEPPLDNVRAEFDRAARTGDYNQALALCYDGSQPHASLHPLDEQAFPEMEEEQPDEEMPQALHVNLCAECGSTFSAEFTTCPWDNTALQPIGPSSAYPNSREWYGNQTSADVSSSSTASLTARPFVLASAKNESQKMDEAKAERIQAEIERLKVLLGEYGPKPEKVFHVFNTVIPYWTVAKAAAVLVLVVFMTTLGYHYGKANAASLKTSINKTRAEIAGVVKDSDIQKELDQKLTLLKGSSIQATVESGIVTLAGITPSKWDSVHAESLALETSGVKLVNNRVEVEDAAPPATTKTARGNRKN